MTGRYLAKYHPDGSERPIASFLVGDRVQILRRKLGEEFTEVVTIKGVVDSPQAENPIIVTTGGNFGAGTAARIPIRRKRGY